ncbi:MAG TPA: hypothetical protein VEJ20_03805, partial [Candidatus Eremiobacteraceae bacterium]|nr:hypothetical protein [Candidatus Eremiobacteraceae bacterium]
MRIASWFVASALMVTAIALAAAPVCAAVGRSFSFPVARASHPLALDPALEDPAWTAGLVPGDGTWEDITTKSPAPLSTDAYMLYDDKNLYVAFRVSQTGVPVVATQTTNDVGFGIDDFVGIGIDTSGAGSNVYLFETTPIGTRYEQASANARYRPNWRARAQRTEGGWSAVMIIPLADMRIPRAGTQTWRLQFIRGVAAKGEHYEWDFNGLMADAPSGSWPPFTDARFWAAGTSVRISAALASKPQPHADLYGLESVGADRDEFEQADQEFEPEAVRTYGADMTLPLTSTISAEGTLNPDFSNVEIDQETIAPQEFRRQLTEYRPFFAQGASFINADSGLTGVLTGPNTNFVFYSPSIGSFDRGLKVEGSYGDENFGLMSFRGFDETTGNTFDDQAFGFEHALQDREFLYWGDGVLAHHSIAGDDSTVEGGVEARNLTSGLIGFADYAYETGSWVPQGHAGSFFGFVDLHQAEAENFIGFSDISPSYDPIDGYTANADLRGFSTFSALFRGSSPGIKSWQPTLNMDRFIDESGAVHQADFDPGLAVVFDDGFSLDGLGPAIGELRSYGIPAG